MFRHFRNFCFVALVAMCAVAVVIGPAGAQTIDDKRAQAAQLQDQIEATNIKLTEMGEQFNAAQIELDRRQLSEIAIADPVAFKGLVEQSRAALKNKPGVTLQKVKA